MLVPVSMKKEIKEEIEKRATVMGLSLSSYVRIACLNYSSKSMQMEEKGSSKVGDTIADVQISDIMGKAIRVTLKDGKKKEGVLRRVYNNSINLQLGVSGKASVYYSDLDKSDVILVEILTDDNVSRITSHQIYLDP